jgi:ribonuclease Z
MRKGPDVLIHEVAAQEVKKRVRNNDVRFETISEHHTTPKQSGTLFSRVKSKMVVYSHIAPPSATEQHLISATRNTYSGSLELGEDLIVIEIGEKIGVRRLNMVPVTSVFTRL